MPNWTLNTINVRGSKEDIATMLNDAVKGENGALSLSSWFPIPETFKKYDTTNFPNAKGLVIGKKYHDAWGNEGIVTEEMIEEYKRATEEQMREYGVVGWHDYRCKYYGCKWDCEVEVLGEINDSVNLAIETPWNAPNAFLLHLSERYPNLTFVNHAVYEEGEWETVSFSKGEGELIDCGEPEYGEGE